MSTKGDNAKQNTKKLFSGAPTSEGDRGPRMVALRLCIHEV